MKYKFSCMDLFVIKDAEYLLCPECRVVNPLCSDDDSKRKRHGLGMGFTTDQLIVMQQELFASCS